MQIANSSVFIHGDNNAPYFSIYSTPYDCEHPFHHPHALTWQQFTDWLTTQPHRSLIAYARKSNKQRAVYVLTKRDDREYHVTDKHTGVLYAIVTLNTDHTEYTLRCFDNRRKRALIRFLNRQFYYERIRYAQKW